MFMRELGRVRVLMPMQARKAFSPMLAREVGRMRDFRVVLLIE
jgi:hypothetical protein